MADMYLNIPIHSFVGTPVIIQLRQPLVLAEVVETQSLPHAHSRERQWIPTEAHDNQSVSASEFIRYAVITSISDNLAVVQWLAPSPAGPVIIESLIATKDILAVTRIVSPPPLPEPAKLIVQP